jgi:drug/metabolite transporter (DMT)-like permease
VGKAGFITARYIVIVAVAGLFMRRKTGVNVWFAVVIAVLGLYVLCMTDGFSVATGDLLILISSFMFAMHILVIDYFSPLVNGVKMSCIQFVVCGLLSSIVMLVTETPDLSYIIQAWGPLLYTGVMSSGVAFTLQIIGQKGMNPTVASLVLCLESCFSVLGGWLILGQHLTTREYVGCLIMFMAILIAQLPGRERVSVPNPNVDSIRSDMSDAEDEIAG